MAFAPPPPPPGPLAIPGAPLAPASPPIGPGAPLLVPGQSPLSERQKETIRKESLAFLEALIIQENSQRLGDITDSDGYKEKFWELISALEKSESTEKKGLTIAGRCQQTKALREKMYQVEIEQLRRTSKDPGIIFTAISKRLSELQAGSQSTNPVMASLNDPLFHEEEIKAFENAMLRAHVEFLHHSNEFPRFMADLEAQLQTLLAERENLLNSDNVIDAHVLQDKNTKINKLILKKTQAETYSIQLSKNAKSELKPYHQKTKKELESLRKKLEDLRADQGGRVKNKEERLNSLEADVSTAEQVFFNVDLIAAQEKNGDAIIIMEMPFIKDLSTRIKSKTNVIKNKLSSTPIDHNEVTALEKDIDALKSQLKTYVLEASSAIKNLDKRIEQLAACQAMLRSENDANAEDLIKRDADLSKEKKSLEIKNEIIPDLLAAIKASETQIALLVNGKVEEQKFEAWRILKDESLKRAAEKKVLEENIRQLEKNAIVLEKQLAASTALAGASLKPKDGAAKKDSVREEAVKDFERQLQAINLQLASDRALLAELSDALKSDLATLNTYEKGNLKKAAVEYLRIRKNSGLLEREEAEKKRIEGKIQGVSFVRDYYATVTASNTKIIETFKSLQSENTAVRIELTKIQKRSGQQAAMPGQKDAASAGKKINLYEEELKKEKEKYAKTTGEFEDETVYSKEELEKFCDESLTVDELADCDDFDEQRALLGQRLVDILQGKNEMTLGKTPRARIKEILGYDIIEEVAKREYEKPLKNEAVLYQTTDKTGAYIETELNTLCAAFKLDGNDKYTQLSEVLRKAIKDRDQTTPLGKYPRAEIEKILGYDIMTAYQQRQADLAQKESDRLRALGQASGAGAGAASGSGSADKVELEATQKQLLFSQELNRHLARQKAEVEKVAAREQEEAREREILLQREKQEAQEREARARAEAQAAHEAQARAEAATAEATRLAAAGGGGGRRPLTQAERDQINKARGRN